MSDMVRKQIYLESRQVRAIQHKAAALGVNESTVIRQAIDRDLYGSGGGVSHPDPSAWDEIEAFLDSRAEVPLAGEPYQFSRDEIYAERMRRFDATDPD